MYDIVDNNAVLYWTPESVWLAGISISTAVLVSFFYTLQVPLPIAKGKALSSTVRVNAKLIS